MFEAFHTWFFTTLIQPALYALGLMAYDDLVFEGSTWFLYGVLQILLLFALVRPLESLFPAESWTDRKETRVDFLYTCINRLGLLPLIFFFTLRPLTDALEAWLRLKGFIPPSLEDMIPALTALPLISFLIYLVILDFADYVRHRLEHRFQWWWELHAVHHSQRKMSLWTDDRNHIVAQALSWLWFTTVALLIGVQPGQFILLIVLGRMIESLSHANIRLSFGWLGDRILVCPAYHRLHHSVGAGHEGKYYGCNFASLFPVWDLMFGTANHTYTYPETGIRDQLEGRDYGNGFWRQQWLALKRIGSTAR
jgi:sterol desaturase/sphingolipid hydroxylase (fatty acid hydroxylase superfamily)